MHAFNDRAVEIQGRCMSACALLSIQGKSIVMKDNYFDPPVLFFHAVFTGEGPARFRQAQVNAGLAKVIALKFPFLELSSIERMMSYENIESGLLVRKRRGADVYIFEDCNPMPNCVVLIERQQKSL